MRIKLLAIFIIAIIIIYSRHSNNIEYGTPYEKLVLEKFDQEIFEKKTIKTNSECQVNVYKFDEGFCGLKIMFNCDQPSLSWTTSCEDGDPNTSKRGQRMAIMAERAIAGNNSNFVKRIISGQTISDEDTPIGFKASSYNIFNNQKLFFTREPLHLNN